MTEDAGGVATGLPPLVAEALHLAEAAEVGARGQRRTASSSDYWFFRPYQGGEPASTIDWRQSARGDRFYVRDTGNRTLESAYFWADRAPSMFEAPSAPGGATKAARAFVLALALAHALLRADQRVTWLSGERRPAQGLSGFNRLAMGLLPLAPSPDERPPMPKARYARILLCSDFRAGPEAWGRHLAAAARLYAKGFLVHVTDPEERYGHATPNALRDLAKRHGWRYVHHVTHEPALNAFMTLNAALAEVV